MSIGWSFPPNNYGKEDGLNDPGIETFLESPLESLAREVIQNSRDATQDSTKPVHVHFSLFDVPRELFPKVEEFAKVLNACKEYWKSNPKTKKFFTNAIDLLEQDHIRFLKISDFNTKGLGGANEMRGRDWHKLTKSVGASDKHEGKDGSFGIGKHAPFACSAFRTVFYGTKAVEDKSTAFQGVAKLVTHHDKNENETQGTGYFGEKTKLRPIFAMESLNNFFERKRYGTDIFIPGFVFGDDWEEKVALSVIKNFFVSINDGQLIVNVGDIRIDSTSLPELMNSLVADKDKDGTTGFYKALVDESAHVFSQENFLEMGPIELHIAVDESLPKQVAMVRQSGMLVYVRKRFRTPLRFSAVFIARGEKLNTFLTSLEPPAHDAWQPQRHSEDIPFAKRVLAEMQNWIVEKIKELSAVSDTEEIDPDGIGEFLPDELDDQIEVGKNTDPDSEARPKNIEIQVRTVAPAGQRRQNANDGGGGDLGPEDEPGETHNDTQGGHPKSRENEGNGGNDGTAGTDNDIGAKNALRAAKINLSRLRLFCSSPISGEYILSYTPDISGTGEIQLNIVGEVGSETAPIAAVENSLNGESHSILKNGAIGPIVFIAGERNVLKIRLAEHIRCAMEVSAHAS